MSAKSSGRTSKTAHVMNLLNKGRTPETAPLPMMESPGQAVPLPAVVDAPESDLAVSSQIKGALEAELLELDEVPVPRTAPVPAEAPAPEQAPPPAAPRRETPPPASSDRAERADAVPAGKPENPINYVNVMQVLVEEKAEKYIQMFGLCQCPRCVVDVKALALSSLPPKYVVMHEGEMVPRITIYESRYNTAVIAQIMRACKAVMDAPRHDLLPPV